ncbi:MAG: sulfatase-like hydrolase/transferase [Planctomycetaceae bacterium]
MRLAIAIGAAWITAVGAARAGERPTILWISAEDLSAATLGCYGGAAHTPRLDALARGGLRFDAAFAAAPVCAPSRSAVITGVMPTTLGSLPMRCAATPPGHMTGFPALLHDAGFWCSNHAKTDYNLGPGFAAGWQESSRKAHWRNRPDPGQPFFAVHNLGVTHESGLFGDRRAAERRTLPPEARRDPTGVTVPPWYPDTPVVRECLAARLELAALLDREVGVILDELAADGRTDDTIVFFWGDHGEGIPHGKRSLTEHGLRVPLIVHVPERCRATATLPGGGPPTGATANLVSLLDLGPTVLALSGVAVPTWMEGRPFLGPGASRRDLVVAASDRMDAPPGFGRTVRDARFRYVRNFLPWLDGDDLPDYAAGVPIAGELRAARRAGTLPVGARWFARTTRPAEELYDVAADPEELADLSADPARAGDLERLRGALVSWMRETKDTGILPEPILRREARAAGSEQAIFHPPTPADAARAARRYDAILETAWAVADGGDAAGVRDGLASPDPAVRFWAVAGTGWAATRRGDPPAALEPLLADPDPTVRIAAATWLVRCGAAADRACEVLGAEIDADDPDIRLAALVAVDGLGTATRPLWPAAAALDLGTDEEYSRRTVERIRRRLAADPR